MSDESQPDESQPEEGNPSSAATSGPAESDTAAVDDADQSSGRVRRATTVVLGVPDSLQRQAPAQRLLQGRIDSRFCLYPCYLLSIAAGFLAIGHALVAPDWATAPVALAWGGLVLWYWLYGVAYRYRRRFFRAICCMSIWTSSFGLCILSADQAQNRMGWNSELAASSTIETFLRGSWMLTLLASVVLLAHVLFLGRGYREKTDRLVGSVQ